MMRTVLQTTPVYAHLFGPVQSRRLGISLGVDMVGDKICSCNCVYCECGPTSELTLKRKEYVPVDGIIAELAACLEKKPTLDYVTFCGSGEPTLNTGIGRAVRFIKKKFPAYRCALLTNGTLFYRPEVRKACMAFDLVLPNLDAVSSGIFSAVNRPHRGLESSAVLEGLSAFRREYRGALWLEIFIVPGMNDTTDELTLLGKAATHIHPDRVQLNTLDRPGACRSIKPATIKKLLEAGKFFSPLPVQIITRHLQMGSHGRPSPVSPETIRTLIARRPSTAEEIAFLTGLTINRTEATLAELISGGSVISCTVRDRTFYRTPDV